LKYVSIADFKTADGIDWAAYQVATARAERENVDSGDRCSRCGVLLLQGPGHPRECVQCRALRRPEELTHDRFVRCPECGHFEAAHAAASDRNGLLEPGDHTVVCGNCGDSYPVNTIVSYSFTSPALSPAAPPPEEET